MPTPFSALATEPSIRSAVSPRRLGAAGRQIAHLFRHHGEAFAVLTRAGRFHGGVQGQQVGLESDLVDDLDDLGDVLTRGVDLVHGGHHFLHLLVALLRGVAGLGGELVGLGGVLGVLLGLGTHLGHGAGDLFQGSSPARWRPWERDWLESETWVEPEAIWLPAVWICPMTSFSLALVLARGSRMRPLLQR